MEGKEELCEMVFCQYCEQVNSFVRYGR